VPPGAGWLTYVRCHDDIGWAISDEDAGAVGLDGYLHRRFLADWYAGEFQPVPVALAHERAIEVAERRPAPDGRPLRAEGDFVVLAPYQYAWLGG
jgi:hypothetical protein